MAETVRAARPDVFGLTLADEHFYAPLRDLPDPGPRYRPTAVPPGWRGTDQGIWLLWDAPGARRAGQGWKIHVSARLERVQHVLDVTADACTGAEVPFKHLSARRFFLFQHHKHANRVQAGKFCALYPPDVDTARLLMDRLAAALAGEEGAYVLTDRRYGDSRTVSYRYGAFTARTRLRVDGTREPVLRDPTGQDVPDERRPSFVLPAGLADPFLPDGPTPHRGPVRLRHYEIVRALQASNAGGAYEARDTRTGTTVFVKEARAHTGLTVDGADARQRLRREYTVLTLLHAATPGLAPEPLDHFTEWEHDFLVTEFVPGTPLGTWIGRRSPLGRPAPAVEDSGHYHRACRRIIASVDAALERLHGLGHRFGDISTGNVMVTPDGRARLVDFEAASPADAAPYPMGTEGFLPPADPLAADPFRSDRYGTGALCLALLAPFVQIAPRAPANLALLRRDLGSVGPVPDDLWARATANYPAPPGTDPDAADPARLLHRLARATTAWLLDVAEPDRADRVFPPPPEAFSTNSTCLAHGTAGVVRALRSSGERVPDAVVARLRSDALATRHELPPGRLVGLAGIAGVLAGTGLVEEAVELAEIAECHPLSGTSTSLGHGRAGIGRTWLELHAHTGDPRHLARATRAGDLLVGDATTDGHSTAGLLFGRSGLALFLHELAAVTGEDRYRRCGLHLLHRELDETVPVPGGALSLPSASGHGATSLGDPCLGTGSAGLGWVLARFARCDERCATALPRIVADAQRPCLADPGLFAGLAGLVLFVATAAPGEGAVRLATALAKFAVDQRAGVAFLGGHARRVSADLAAGAAGVLMALNRVLPAPARDRPGEEVIA